VDDAQACCWFRGGGGAPDATAAAAASGLIPPSVALPPACCATLPPAMHCSPDQPQCWAFSASMSLVTAVSSYVQRGAELPADWEVHDLMPGGGGPSQPAAQAAVRQMAAAVAAAAAADGVAGSSGSAGADRCVRGPAAAVSRPAVLLCVLHVSLFKDRMRPRAA
jgi:hypothetical protein